MKKRKRKSAHNPLVQFGAPKDTVKVLATLDARLEQALTLGREESAKEIARNRETWRSEWRHHHK